MTHVQTEASLALFERMVELLREDILALAPLSPSDNRQEYLNAHSVLLGRLRDLNGVVSSACHHGHRLGLPPDVIERLDTIADRTLDLFEDFWHP